MPVPVEPEDQPLVDAVKSIPAEVWYSVSKWAKETDSLYSSQRSIAYKIGQVIDHGYSPSVKQANSGRKLIKRACELGFVHEKLTTELIAALNDFPLDESED